MQGDGNKSSGIIKLLSPIKGYGFIAPDDGGEEVFFHVSRIKVSASGFLSLGVGNKVEFNIEHDDKGRPMAVNVTGPNGGLLQGGVDPNDAGRGRYENGSLA